MKKEHLYKIINDICVFKNPNNFNDYHKKIFKKKKWKNELSKNYFYASPTNIDFNFNNNGQFLEDVIVNYSTKSKKNYQ